MTESRESTKDLGQQNLDGLENFRRRLEMVQMVRRRFRDGLELVRKLSERV